MIPNELEYFKTVRGRTLALAQQSSQAQLDQVPEQGGWSAGEVLDHLVLAEKLNRDQFSELIAMARAGRRPELRRSFSDVNVSIAYIPKPLLPLFEVPFTVLNFFVPTRVREWVTRNPLIPVQNPDAATPRRGRSAEELRRDLAASLSETEGLFAANADLDYGAMMIEHPLMGRHDVRSALRFLSLHEERHQQQFLTIVSSLRSPRA